MGLFDSFLNPQNGYKDAQAELEKYFAPLINQGQDAYGGLSSAMNQLLNPEQLQNQWTQGYQMSPQAMQAQEMAKQQGLDAASSQGLLGSSSALKALQGGASQIGLNDRQNYLNDLMQKYMSGTGIAQNVYNTGANAAMNMGQNSAQMAYGAANSGGDLFGSLLGSGMGLLGSAFGGPLGGMAGSMLGGTLSQAGGGLPVGTSWSTGGR